MEYCRVSMECCIGQKRTRSIPWPSMCIKVLYEGHNCAGYWDFDDSDMVCIAHPSLWL